MKVGTLVQFKAYNVVMGVGIVLRHCEEDSDFMWISDEKLGPQRVRKDHSLLEVLSEAR